MSIITCVAISGSSSISSSSTYHHVASRNWASSLSGRKRSGFWRKPVSVQIRLSSSPSPSWPARWQASSISSSSRRHHLEQPEVQERDAAVGHQQEVARVRVAGELVVAVHAAEEEAEDDLADAVARGLVHLLDRVEARARDVLADQHALARQRGHDVRHDDERVAAEDAREPALVLRLELVVELVADARADLLGGGLDVEPRRDALHQPQDQPEVLHVGPHGLGDARVLDLDRDVAPVVQPRAVDLADRGRGDRVLVERVERLARAAPRGRTR